MLLLLAGCATNPVTGAREFVMMSEAQEIAMGREADGEVRRQMGLYEDDALQRYVEEIGLALATRSHRPELPWSFAIVDSPAINAFALPGGFIYLTRGIMPFLSDEADLAGVLGHEIGHVTARHTVRAYTRASGAQLGLLIGSIFSPAARAVGGLAEIGLGVLFLRYGRDAELQADRLGAEYAAISGWDPAGVRDMLSTLSRISEGADRRGVPSWLSTHPAASDRVERVGSILSELAARMDTTGLRVNRRGYLDRLDGLVYGDNPEQGVVRGRDFLHTELRFALRFPAGWEVVNTETQVVATQPGEEVYMVLQLVTDPRRETSRRWRSTTCGAAGIGSMPGARPRSAGSTRLSGRLPEDAVTTGSPGRESPTSTIDAPCMCWAGWPRPRPTTVWSRSSMRRFVVSVH